MTLDRSTIGAGLVRRGLVVVAAVLAGLATGGMLTVVAARGGPVAPVALVGGLVLVVLVLRRPVWAVVPLLATFPLSQVELAGLGAVQVGATAAVGLAVASRLARGEAVVLVPARTAWLVVLWVLGLVAAVLGVAPGESLNQVVLLATGIAVVLALVTVTTDAPDLRIVVAAVLVVAGVMCATSLSGFGQAQAAFGGTLVEGRSQGSFAQPNELGTFAAVTLVLAVGWLLAGTERLRLLAGGVAFVAAGALLASLSRGAWIGTAVAIGTVVLLRPASRRVVVTSLVLGALSVTVGLTLAPATPQVEVVRARAASFADPTGNPYDDRPSIYREGVRQVRANPLTGVGPAAFRIEASRQLENGARTAPHHAHNTLLAVSAEAGLPTTLVLVAFTLSTAVAVRRRLRELVHVDPVRDAVLTGSTAALAVLVGQGLVDFSLRNPTLLFTVFLLLGLQLSTLRRA